jgi:hypothetical protein
MFRTLLIPILCLLFVTAVVSAQGGIDEMRLLGRNNLEFAHMMDFQVKGDYAYASVGLGLGFQTYLISDPQNITRVDRQGQHAWRSHIAGDLAFSFHHDGGFSVYDISFAVPAMLGSYNPSGNTSYESGVLVEDDLFVAAHNEGLARFDLSHPGAPVLLSSIPLAENACWDVVATNEFLFIANGRFGLSIVDLGNLTEVAAIDLPGLASDVELSENNLTAFLALGPDGVIAVDITDPLSPVIRSHADTFGNVISMGRVGEILIAGSYAYAERFDISDPDAIIRSGWDATTVYAMGADGGVNSQGDTLLVVADWRGMAVYAPEADPGGDIEVYPLRLDFGEVTASADTTVLVRNNGAGVLTVSAIQAPSGITVVPDLFTLDPGETQAVVVSAGFEPVRGLITYQSTDPDEGFFKQFVYVNNSNFPQNGSAVPEFTLSGTDGESHSLSDYAGKVVFLEFGANW